MGGKWRWENKINTWLYVGIRAIECETQQKQELHRASALVECQNALKSWESKDLGQGHPNGGAREHCRNRLNVLDRVHARSKPLPPDLQNDWLWFVKQWDAAMLRNLPSHQKVAWGSEFLKTVNTLLDRIRADGDALAKWMRSERSRWLGAPALIV